MKKQSKKTTKNSSPKRVLNNSRKFSISNPKGIKKLDEIKDEHPNTNVGDTISWDLEHNDGYYTRQKFIGYRKHQDQKKKEDQKRRYHLKKEEKKHIETILEIQSQRGTDWVLEHMNSD